MLTVLQMSCLLHYSYSYCSLKRFWKAMESFSLFYFLESIELNTDQLCDPRPVLIKQIYCLFLAVFFNWLDLIFTYTPAKQRKNWKQTNKTLPQIRLCRFFQLLIEAWWTRHLNGWDLNVLFRKTNFRINLRTINTKVKDVLCWVLPVWVQILFSKRSGRTVFPVPVMELTLSPVGKTELHLRLRHKRRRWHNYSRTTGTPALHKTMPHILSAENNCPLKGMVFECPFRASNLPNWLVTGQQFGAVDVT